MHLFRGNHTSAASGHILKRERRNMDRKKLVSESIDYIIQHLNEELSLDTVAAHFYISKFHFSRIFREETGETTGSKWIYVFRSEKSKNSEAVRRTSFL